MAHKLIGKKFGKLLVIKRGTNDKNRNRRWLCKCDCGKNKEILGLTLVSGRGTSCGCSTRNIGTTTSYRGLLNIYRHSAKSTGRDFDLTEEQFISIVSSPCHYCGIEHFSTYNIYLRADGTRNRFQLHGKVSREYIDSITITYNGIDRKDNKKGYILSNCLPCCKICNFAKKSMSYKLFKEWISIIASFNVDFKLI